MIEKKIHPKCLNDEGEHFVSAKGYWYPCCVLEDDWGWYFQNDDFHVLKSTNFHLNQRYLDWVKKELSDYDNAPGSCKKKCSKCIDNTNKFYSSADDAEFY